MVKNKPHVFVTRLQWRQWLQENQRSNSGLWVLMNKKHVGRGLQYSDAVEEALCFGWIDGQLRRVNDTSHLIRFSPRRPGSVWAPSNIARVKKMIKTKKMTAAGLKIFRMAKFEKQTAPTALAPKSLVVPLDLKQALMKNSRAWRHWQQRSPSHRRIAIWWVKSAKQPATRTRRIQNVVVNTARYKKAHW